MWTTIGLLVALAIGVAVGALTGFGGWLRGRVGMAGTEQASSPEAGRDHIANKVIFWSGIGIAIVSTVVLVVNIAPAFVTLTTEGAKYAVDARAGSQQVFNALIPLFGTWVGTVLAFYFSNKNFESAAKATRELLGDDRLRQISVRQAWIPVDQIKAATIPAGKTEADVEVDDLKVMLVGKVTRIPIWDDNKVVKYVLHKSLIFEFLATKSAALTAPKLSDLLAVAGFKEQALAINFIGQDDTLGDAKKAMESKRNCQDVFVTANGKSDIAVVGWITNIEIAKNSKAGA
jgi:uncharacterized membrane protein